MTDANSIKTVMAFVFGALGALAAVYALVLWGQSKFGEQQGGLAEKQMMGAIACSIAMFAAASLVMTLDFNYRP